MAGADARYTIVAFPRPTTTLFWPFQSRKDSYADRLAGVGKRSRRQRGGPHNDFLGSKPRGVGH